MGHHDGRLLPLLCHSRLISCYLPLAQLHYLTMLHVSIHSRLTPCLFDNPLSLTEKDGSFQVVPRSPCLGRGSWISRFLQYDLMPIADSCYCHRSRPGPTLCHCTNPHSYSYHCPEVLAALPACWYKTAMFMAVCYDVNAYHVCDLTSIFVLGYTTNFLFSFCAILVRVVCSGLRRIYRRISSRTNKEGFGL